MRHSRAREKVGQLIRDAFKAKGILCELYVGDFVFPEGSWRRADVFRWELNIRLCINGHWRIDEICSWETLTDCARHGIEIDYEHRGSSYKSWEAHALPRRAKEPNT